MPRMRSNKSEWHQLEPLRALFAIERVWLESTLRARVSGVRLWLAPDAGVAADVGAAQAIALHPHGGSWSGALRAQSDALPLADGSVSLLVVQHVIEDLAESAALLRECERVLSSDGELIVLGLNPTSLWHGWIRYRARAPRRWHLAGRLRATLTGLGLKVAPSLGLGPLQPHGRMQALADSGALRVVCAAYALRARKRETQVIPLRTALPRRSPAQGTLVPNPSPFNGGAVGRVASMCQTRNAVDGEIADVDCVLDELRRVPAVEAG